MKNDPRNRFLTLLPIRLYISIDEIRQLQFLDDSRILDGESLDGGLVHQQQLNDLIILDGESFNEVGAVRVLLKEEKVEDSKDCSICLESVAVGKILSSSCLTPRNRFLTLLLIHLYISIDEIRQLQFLDDSRILDGESLDGGLVHRQQLDDLIILDGESFNEVGAVRVLLKEEKVENSKDYSICLESVVVGKMLLNSHVFTFITQPASLGGCTRNPYALSIELVLSN
ncbi:hypothetical protein JRO89_XS02G0267400 [Xanthoceras sorbifolium]|uniref:Uncharacterized protein n=1 Tax=Xanthoceras sorbifolium TaxID=99658 RepID=A0ABQ8IHK7_9ROSI|nr:hypothetical protein JRO89_XS02G0267400 [Xanthoceras sorbifolium]